MKATILLVGLNGAGKLTQWRSWYSDPLPKKVNGERFGKNS